MRIFSRNRWFCIFVFILASFATYAQFPYNETFKNGSSSGLTISGAAKLTAQAGIDPVGQGYLRLNENTTNSIGYAYGQTAFPSRFGITVSFEFFDWKTGATATNQADGMTFFLFDASVNAFRPGGTGGSLGYAQYYATPGLAKGYIGISLDEFGNFSSATDGNKNGGPGQQRGSVAIRGPGNGKAVTDYVYQTGVIASDPSYNAGFTQFSQRYPDSSTSNYRKLKIILTPGSSLGAGIGYKITILIYKGGSTVTPVPLISNFDYPFIAPANFQFGLAASTGSITNYHEVRNMVIEPTNTPSLLAATAVNDMVTAVCQGQGALIDVTANDISNNAGGSINKASVDLDPLTPGQQTTLNDPLKGNYIADSNGIIKFTPAMGFTGTALLNYTVTDTYGMASNTATLSITAGSSAAPDLTLLDPPPSCAPSLINITSAAWKTAFTTGSTFSYFSSLSDANNGINNINLTASTIGLPGTYYVRADMGGCATVKPIKVVISPLPSLAVSGADQSFCSATGAQTTTLVATNPDFGTGSWSQVAGPSGVNINYPTAATSPLSVSQQGVYTFRWMVNSGACPASVADLQMSVGNTTALAGIDQVLSNVNQITLSGNLPVTGTGKWTLVSSPATSVVSINLVNSPLTTVQINKTGNYVFKWTITNGACSNFSQVNVNVLTLLPITLLNFTGKPFQNDVLLEWTTGTETGTSRFDVERSLDGVHFSTIRSVPAKGNSMIDQAYQCKDNVSGVQANQLFYRLTEIDADGHIAYSKIISVRLPAQNALRSWPNPVENTLFVQVPHATSGVCFIKLFDAQGRLLTSLPTVTGTPDGVFLVPLDGLPDGLLFGEIVTPSGTFHTAVIKTIRKR